MTGELLRTRNEVAYRKIEALNQSALCDYATSPLKFYQKHILKNNVDEEESASISIGTLCDFHVLECEGKDDVFQQRFDEQFVLNKENRGTKQVFVLVDELFKVAKKTVDENNIVQGNFTVMFQEAFQNVQNMKNLQGNPYYSGKDWKKGLVEFNEKGKDYYDLLISHIGKIVIDEGIINISRRIKEQLFGDDNIREIFIDDGKYEILNKFPIEFKYKGWDCKAELDKIKIDHENRIIHLYDLKCSWMNSDWHIAYLKNKYYIQAAWYWKAVLHWAWENDMKDYEIKPMAFIIGDTSANKMRPLIYETSQEHLDEGQKGFTYRGVRNKGINELLDNLKWSMDNNIWNIDPTNYKNKSIVKLRTFNEIDN